MPGQRTVRLKLAAKQSVSHSRAVSCCSSTQDHDDGEPANSEEQEEPSTSPRAPANPWNNEQQVTLKQEGIKDIGRWKKNEMNVLWCCIFVPICTFPNLDND
jgi:hypothetical protein